MTRRDSLRALYEAVKAGTATRTEVENLAYGIWQDERMLDAGSAYHNDMNAALALHKAVLPHIKWELWQSGEAYVCNFPRQNTEYAPDPARALLLADLAAMIEGEG
jgi:hypothetical protein